MYISLILHHVLVDVSVVVATPYVNRPASIAQGCWTLCLVRVVTIMTIVTIRGPHRHHNPILHRPVRAIPYYLPRLCLAGTFWNTWPEDCTPPMVFATKKHKKHRKHRPAKTLQASATNITYVPYPIST